jgi:hypothetical protein
MSEVFWTPHTQRLVKSNSSKGCPDAKEVTDMQTSSGYKKSTNKLFVKVQHYKPTNSWQKYIIHVYTKP